MLSLEGNTAPYLINAYVRIRSIFRKGGLALDAVDPQSIALREPAERGLALQLVKLPRVVDAVAHLLEPHRLCGYLYELASSYHQFYEHCPVLRAPNGRTRACRLALSALVAKTLRLGLQLLGMEVVEQM